MAYPKVKFSNIPLKFELGLFYNFLFENTWGWGRYITKTHPQFKLVLKLKIKKEREAAIKKYAVAFWNKNKKKLLAQKKVDTTKWRKVENNFFEVLPQIMETSWPENRRTINAMISIIPICPRFLDNWSFSLSGLWRGAGAIEVIMHEICHFLYFKKWKEVFPQAERQTFDKPYLEWHLSEILAPVILGDKRVQKILSKKPDFYREHKRIKIGNKSVPAYFLNIYQKHLNQETSFEDFLKVAYREIKVHRKLFRF